MALFSWGSSHSKDDTQDQQSNDQNGAAERVTPTPPLAPPPTTTAFIHTHHVNVNVAAPALQARDRYKQSDTVTSSATDHLAPNMSIFDPVSAAHAVSNEHEINVEEEEEEEFNVEEEEDFNVEEEEDYSTGEQAPLPWNNDNDNDHDNERYPEQEYDDDYVYHQSTQADERMSSAPQEDEPYNHYENGQVYREETAGQFGADEDQDNAQEHAHFDSFYTDQDHTHGQDENENESGLSRPLASTTATVPDEWDNNRQTESHPPMVLPQYDTLQVTASETTKNSYSHSYSESRSLTVHIDAVPVETVEVSSHTLIALPNYSYELMTPSPICNSNFFFLSDEKSVPTELNRVQDKAVQRRREFQKSIHDLQCRVGALAANVAEESMDRERSLEHVQDAHLDGPLEEMVERIALQQEAYQSQDLDTLKSSSNSSCTTNWRDLERRLCTLDSQMAHSVHVQFQDAKRKQLGSLSDVLENEITNDTKLEDSKADKREGGLVRRFESLVGTMVRRHQEEHATRIAALQVAADKLGGETLGSSLDPSRADAAVLILRELRVQLEQERAERHEQDERLVELIMHRMATMKRALLEASGGP
jgi:RNAse (barnase) inhibitor barstar